MNSYLQGVRRYVRYTLVDERWPTIAIAIATTLRAVSQALFALTLGQIASGLADSQPRQALFGLLFLGLVLIGLNAEEFLIGGVWGPPIYRAMQMIRMDIWRLNLHAPEIRHLHEPTYLDTVDRLEKDNENLVKLIFSLLRPVNSLIDLAITTVVLAYIHPVLALLPLAAVPSLYTNAVNRRRDEKAEAAATQHDRMEALLDKHVASTVFGKEVKAWQIEPWLDGLAGQAWGRASAIRLRARLRAAWVDALGWLPFVGAVIAAVIWLAQRATSGGEVGDLVVFITVASQTRQRLYGLVFMTSRGAATGYAFQRFDWLHAYHEESAPTAPPTADRLATGIELRDVSLTYPERSAAALDAVSIQLPAGTTVAVVGENGAGKSTLIAVLLGLLKPDAGRLLIDGVELGPAQMCAWRSHVTAAFQDTPRVYFTVSELIGLGAPDKHNDTAAIEQALTRSGSAGLVNGLTRGLETQLGSQFGGVDLSGGQWQRLSLARASMRPDALLLIVDEPTSALDPQAEREAFERLTHQIDTARAKGAIALLVSHRMASLRLADVIIVLEKGRVTATGSHETLLAAGGLYADLYTMQAGAYR